MEEWLEAGPLSQEEFRQLVKLTARYVYWDVDQFDHWVMPAPTGSMYVDFNQGFAGAYPEDAYRPMWPNAEAGDPVWSLWRQDDNGNRVEMARYANENAAKRHQEEYERRGHKQLYWIERTSN